MYLVRLKGPRWMSVGSRKLPSALLMYTSRGCLVLACSALFLLFMTFPTRAQDGESNEEWMLGKAQAAFFHVSVEGTLKDDVEGGAERERDGKAFAVGPSLLITAQHVVGDHTEWKAQDNVSSPIRLSVRPVMRTVVLKRADTDTDSEFAEFADPVVLTAPTYGPDAAGISIPGLTLKDYFRLSMCDIVKGQQYTAIMTKGDDPADPVSIGEVAAIKLKAAGYDRKKFGALYIFDPVDDPPLFKSDPKGHEGSPILEGDSVVALISAVIVPSGGKPRILATPIQPLLPSASTLLSKAADTKVGAEVGLKCSLSDTVEQLYDQVARHAEWRLKIDRDKTNGVLRDLYLQYVSVGEEVNIESIELDFEYWGRQRSNSKDATVIKYSGMENNTLILPREPPAKERQFDLAEVVSEGVTVVEASLEAEDRGGSIDFVRIKIFETKLRGGGTVDKETVLEFSWVERSND